MSSLVKRSIVAFFLTMLVAFSFATHKRVTDTADVVTAGRETVDIGDHIVAVLEPESRVAYTVDRSVLGERATVEQRSGRAIYRVREGALDVRSAGGALAVEGDAVIIVEGARYAVADGGARPRGLVEDASLLRALDDVNDGRGGDLLQRLAELERMRADLERTPRHADR